MKTDFNMRSIRAKFNLSYRARVVIVMSLGIIGIAFIATLGVKGLQNLNNWWDRHYLAFDSLKVELPRIRVENREPERILVPVVTLTNNKGSKSQLSEEDKKEVMKNSGYYKLLSGIRILESSNNYYGDGTGHHVDCQKIGMSNEFGYDALSDFCFGSFEESVKFLTTYIEENLSQMSLNSFLCYYNTGNKTSVCDYSKNYHKLDKDGKLASN